MQDQSLWMNVMYSIVISYMEICFQMCKGLVGSVFSIVVLFDGMVLIVGLLVESYTLRSHTAVIPPL